MSISENLQILRKSKNMSQEELAEKLNVSRQAVSKWESGSGYPETEKIISICEIFDCSMDELVKGKIADDIKAEKNNYDSIMTSTAKGIAIAVGIIILGTAAMMTIMGVLNGQEQSHLLGVIAVLVAVIFAVPMLIVVGTKNDKFIKNGKVDFSCPEFRELAEYVNENVSDKAVSEDEAITSDYSTAAFSTFYGMMDYFSGLAKQNGNATILGLPSSDGRGPMAKAYTSVAVSADAADIDACVEFINVLLSDEIQEELALSEHFVLNRESFREYGMLAVDCFNGPSGDWMFDGGSNGSRMMFSENDINKLEQIVLSCSRVQSTDPSISAILAEEMPAYFTGQKDLDAVIDIAQDRVQKVLDERG